nr:hypothetical protein BaRGS_001752 [Batillaria attramentaria]
MGSRNVSARWRRLQQQHFEYDLFVCYASEDLSWVQSYLMPELEDRLKLRLCIHERNFIPGTPIVDNIAECVEKSKKVLMLFSTNFARSPWCQFELAFCLSHVLDNDDFLVIACLHYIPSRDLTTAMMALYKTTTYIQWASSEDARRCFWGRLRIALHEVIPLDRRLPIEC